MTKVLLSLLFFFSFFFVSSHAYAATLNPCGPGNENDIMCQVSNLQVGSTIGVVLQFVFIIAVVLALGFLVFGGIKWLTSGGEKEGVASARGTIIAAIVGLIIIVLSYFILNLVLVFLTGEGISGIQTPNLCGQPGGAPCRVLNETTGNVDTQCWTNGTLTGTDVAATGVCP